MEIIQDNTLTKEEEEDIKSAFDLFVNENTGTADMIEILDALSLLGYEEKNPKIFHFFENIENYQKLNNLDGITFKDFLNFINDNLKNSQLFDDLKEIYNLFLLENNNHNKTLTSDNLIKIFKDLGENITEEEIKDILSKASSNGKDINFNDFFDIMANGSIP